MAYDCLMHPCYSALTVSLQEMCIEVIKNLLQESCFFGSHTAILGTVLSEHYVLFDHSFKVYNVIA